GAGGGGGHRRAPRGRGAGPAWRARGLDRLGGQCRPRAPRADLRTVNAGRLVLYADGAARGNPGPAGAGAVLFDEGGAVVAELTKALGRATNNVAEYTALILELADGQRRGS